ncbi:hypothetical protein FPY71_09020 [Aureimonas fodinaquatilis]|uniref:Lipoprotein n=1 Tax=Aureimonas fodinaquatilis TaxID=2565783 RepID=A0A5B0DW82_9HYPH|nr:hypothetical protein [Aureimonas fodinaquatilis]KAA0970628.1 hypothetical protein FPY71_09020 [Aureimonas fodinaquatilis]
MAGLFRSVALLAFAALLAACVTMTPEEQRAADEAQCREYGFVRKNDAFAQCMQNLDLARRADQRARLNSMDDPLFPSVVYQPVIIAR